LRTRIPAIARKELYHMTRDWRSLAMAFALPLLMLVLFSYAMTFDVRGLELAVADEDRSSASRLLVERFVSSGYFKLMREGIDAREAVSLLDDGQVQLAMVIPHGYARSLERDEEVSVQVLIDGSDNNTASIAAGYVEGVFASANDDLVRMALVKDGISPRGFPPLAPSVRVWFNPELESTNTIVPGLISIIMMMVAALLTSLTIVRERENGSLEGLIATPVHRHEILLGKMAPYLGVAILDCLLVAAVGHYGFGVPFNGSVILFVGAAFVFCVACLAIGLAASVAASSQVLANQIVMMTTMMPSMILSGFVFPVKSMPGWVQVFTHAVPARYFVSICRGLMLKDQPAQAVLLPLLFLVVFAAVVLTLAFAGFRKKI
jgi:ABC-2 type transport system permease protein